MMGHNGIPTCEECGEWLTGRQTRFCSARCRQRTYRRGKPGPAEKQCILCGAQFRPMRGNQRWCDFENTADSTCAGMQLDWQQKIRAAKNELHEARMATVCAREGCEEIAGYPSEEGRPRRFCSDRCKTAHYRAEKRRKESPNV